MKIIPISSLGCVNLILNNHEYGVNCFHTSHVDDDFVPSSHVDYICILTNNGYGYHIYTSPVNSNRVLTSHVYYNRINTSHVDYNYIHPSNGECNMYFPRLMSLQLYSSDC